MNRFTIPVAALGIALALSACSSPETAQTLASTKSPAQLLRNEIADRIPASAIEGGLTVGDSSEACDQQGTVRSWRSDAVLAVVPDQAPRLRVIAETLVQSFVDQGWTASTRDASSKLVEFRLTSSSSPSEVHITADASDRRTITIVVNGPCVTTDGADSDEVTSLED